ncbi:alpha/beta fold hydrolase [Nocardioides daeguensis]|uniref:Alpha/beta hydrolase n=2 Tax=Nocardioides daeguensis TaxID=908359 RepID=A0ABP6W6P1_9ACTN|nr:alpha/beta fold hydrolase [Nocardioides daeguensis]MCR1775083.1 alpha/beta fold hydrolase [Nocardioides daeguensis]
MTMSEELLAPVSAQVELCYQTFGDPQGEPLLLVMGLGGPMTWWPRELCVQLAEAGFHVVRYDNRDTGRSSRLAGRVTTARLARAFVGAPAPAPYSITDLANDALGLMAHLGWGSAHVAGVSMGGMIAQTMALAAPERVRSLTSIMSTTGRRAVGWQSPALLPTLVAPRGPGREAYIRRALLVWGIIGSPGFPQDEAELRRRAGETWDRGIDEAGVLRQMMAVVTQTDRTRRLAELRMPTLVMHGLADRMVHVSGGRATAAAIRGAELVVVPGWGHDLPAALFPTFTRGIRRTADRAASR